VLYLVVWKNINNGIQPNVKWVWYEQLESTRVLLMQVPTYDSNEVSITVTSSRTSQMSTSSKIAHFCTCNPMGSSSSFSDPGVPGSSLILNIKYLINLKVGEN